MSRGQNELIAEFKMAAGDVISIGVRLQQELKGVGEIWYGLQLEGVSCWNCF